jgi:hypothetical protein
VFGGPVSPQSDVPNASEARSPASEQASEPRTNTYSPQPTTYSPQPAPPENSTSHSQQMPHTPVRPQDNEASPSFLSESVADAAVRTAVSPSEVDSAEERDMPDLEEVFPCWNADDNPTLAYHAQTKLKDGQLSMIVDPGAWASIMGEDLAEALKARAEKNGLKPRVVPMPNPISVAGVGSGSQRCTQKLICPIAVNVDEHGASLHELQAPIVGDDGKDLPGLLGLKALKATRGILDCNGKKLHLLGPGEFNPVLPPGSITIPLQEAPSGHLVMIIDDYEAAIKNAVENPTPKVDRKVMQFATSEKSETKKTSSPTSETKKPGSSIPKAQTTKTARNRQRQQGRQAVKQKSQKAKAAPTPTGSDASAAKDSRQH